MKRLFWFSIGIFQVLLAYIVPVVFYYINLIDTYNLVFFFVSSIGLVFSGCFLMKYAVDNC